ncbi:MAG TPA: SPOR domain-containing protein [Alphaproteobacteria bacterium]|nr:SPOR domain-containing protein [Alphaproteobacteria bacterium]
MLPDPNDRPARPVRKSPLPLRFFAVGFATVALTVFFGLIGYTYFTRGGGGDGPVPLIKADPRPMKIAPEKPGGMDVPHQDKEIYARLNREAPQAQGTRIERLLPPPESPLPRPRPPEAPAPLAPDIPPAPVVEPPPNAIEVTQPPPPAPPRPTEPAKPTSTKQAAPAPAPQQQAAVPRAANPAQATAPSAGGGSRYRIQLAALRTSEDATREWEKLRRAHMDVLGPLTLNVVRADLGDRGTFYRIQAGPVADEQAAKELCRRLAEKKVGCIVVRP